MPTLAARELVDHRAEDAPAARLLRLPALGIETPAVTTVLSANPLPEVADHVVHPEAIVHAGGMARAHADPR